MINKNSSLDQAYDHCRKITLGHYENFPVGSILIPKKNRKHFFALYAFMRTADDFADLTSRPREIRLQLIRDWRLQLDKAISGRESQHPIFVALSNTISECQLPSEPFYKLLEAFEFDATGDVDFATFDDLRWYTSRSAEPVGELVLALFGYRNVERITMSNDICTGLQLLNFIQDIKEDLGNNRYYYPSEDCEIFGVNLKSVGGASVRSDRLESVPLSLLSLFELDRVESLIDRGAPLAESVHGRLRYELRAVIRAARKMIAKIRKLEGSTYRVRPKLSKSEHALILLQSIMFR
jgi:squalene synthase HpnC